MKPFCNNDATRGEVEEKKGDRDKKAFPFCEKDVSEGELEDPRRR